MTTLSALRAKMSILLLYFCFLVHHNVIAIYYYTPEQILLNCGSSSGGQGSDGRPWTGELMSSSKIRLLESSGNKSVNASAPFQGSVDAIPYMTARLSRSQFTYSFSVSPGKKFIRLHFHPAAYEGFVNSKDFFDVKLGRHIILGNFSASMFATNWDIPSFLREFYVGVARNQKLNVTFYPFKSDFNDTYAFINGIEIVSMPETLYYSSNDSVGLPSVGLNPEQEFHIGNDTVMEIIIRLNVGGNTISPINDTGMYREWDADWMYVNPVYGVLPREPNIILNYSRIPRYTAPDDIYRSARTMGQNRSENEKNNLTWNVPVDAGFNYLVRLHFCEFVLEVENVNVRRFIIYIDNQTAEAAFDVFEASGGRNIPIYKDYVVAAGKKGQTGDYTIFVTLHPHPSSLYPDAILNGLEIFKLSNPDGTLASGINPEAPASQTPAPAPVQSPPPAINKSNNKKTLFLILGASIFGFFLIVSLCLIIISSLRKRKNYDNEYQSSICSWLLNSGNWKSSRHEKGSSSLPIERCQKFSLAEIKAATNNFHQELMIGRGGFGNVYRGEIVEKSTTMTVAIKRFNPESRSRQGAKEFKTEIEMLSQLRHNHLVSLIGYCNDKGEMILVYDYMSNGTLNDHLYETNNDPIPWKQRLGICIGAASGLNYLHEDAVHKIVHRDVKTTNILLDEKWVAKVSDFGLSKIFLEDKAVTTKVKGTWGYLDPEYFRGQALTEKSDVYSFGVVLLEVLCARRAVNSRLDEDQRNLANWVQKCIKEETIHEIIDPYLTGRIAPECFNTFVDVAQRCIRNQGTHRPTMKEVKDMLEFALQLQVAADSDQKKGKDPDGGVGDCVYPVAPFRAPPVYTAEDVGGDGDDDNDGLEWDTSSSSGCTSSMNIPGQGSGTLKPGNIFSGTTSSSTQ